MILDEETLGILIEAHSEGMHVFRAMEDHLQDMRRSIFETNVLLDELTVQMAASTAATEAMNATMQDFTPAMESAGPATEAASAGLGEMGAVLPVVALGLAGVLVVLSPFVVELTASVTLLTAFGVGVAAVLSTLAAAATAFGGLGIAVVLLADRLYTSGKLATDPLAKLEEHMGTMADTLGRKALPAAQEVIAWLDNLLPKVEAVGSAVIDWFGQRIPMVLQIASRAVDATFGALGNLGGAVGSFLDKVMAAMPRFEPVFTAAMDVAVGAVRGLLDNLLRLSNWFTERLPAMGPQVAGIMGHIGEVIQGLGDVSGRVVDWFSAHWPTITKVADETWKSIVAGWNWAGPVLNVLLPAALELVRGAFAYARMHADELRGMLFLVGVAAAALTVPLVGLEVVLLIVFTKVIELVGAIQKVATWFHNAADAVGGFIDKLTHAIGLIHGFPTIGGGSALSFDTGGVVPGPIGAPTLAVVHGGETVIPASGGGGGSGAANMDDTNELLAHAVSLLDQIARNTKGPVFSTAAYGSR